MPCWKDSVEALAKPLDPSQGRRFAEFVESYVGDVVDCYR